MPRKVDDIPSAKVSGHDGFVARSLFTSPDKKTTVRILDIDPGGVGPVPAHAHSDRHLFMVLEGVLELDMDERTVTVPAGSYVEVEPEVNHQLRCSGHSPLKILAIKHD